MLTSLLRRRRDRRRARALALLLTGLEAAAEDAGRSPRHSRRSGGSFRIAA